MHPPIAAATPTPTAAGLTLRGTEGDDRLEGQDLDDVLLGLGGNDFLDGKGGNDRIEGGDGDDTIMDSAGTDLLFGGAGKDTIFGGALSADGFREGGTTIDGGDGDDTLYAYLAAGRVIGGRGDDAIRLSISSGQGIATPMLVDAGEGNDRITIAGSFTPTPRAVTASGGAGSDLYRFEERVLPVLTITDFQAGAGGDVVDLYSLLPTTARGNPFAPGGGMRLVQDGTRVLLQHDTDGAGPLDYQTRIVFEAATLSAFSGANFSEGARPDGSSTGLSLNGTDGADRISGMRLDDTVRGGAGADQLNGLLGNDTLYGDAGNDRLDGGEGDDHLLGGDNNDTLAGQAGNDRLEGGGGDDALNDTGGDNLLDGGEGNDTLLASGGGVNTLRGGAGHDLLHVWGARGATLDGGSGRDTLDGGAGDDVLIGGGDIDTVRLEGARGDYAVTRGADNWRVADLRSAGVDGSDTLDGVERLAFDGGMVALDIDGGAGQAYRLYRAAFDRTPDEAGLGFWIRAIDRGTSLTEIAAGFAASDEFAALYGNTPSNAELVGRLYQNILDRAPDPGGYDYWRKALDDKLVTLPEVLAMFSESAENKEGVAALVANGIAYQPYV